MGRHLRFPPSLWRCRPCFGGPRFSVARLRNRAIALGFPTSPFCFPLVHHPNSAARSIAPMRLLATACGVQEGCPPWCRPCATNWANFCSMEFPMQIILSWYCFVLMFLWPSGPSGTSRHLALPPVPFLGLLVFIAGRELFDASFVAGSWTC